MVRNGSDNSFGVDEVEIDWLFNFGKVTAQVDLEYEGDRSANDDLLKSSKLSFLTILAMVSSYHSWSLRVHARS